jgi:hypothetical protein
MGYSGCSDRNEADIHAHVYPEVSTWMLALQGNNISASKGFQATILLAENQ